MHLQAQLRMKSAGAAFFLHVRKGAYLREATASTALSAEEPETAAVSYSWTIAVA